MSEVTAPAAAEPVLSCTGLRKRFHEGDLDVEVLRGVDFAVRRGETVAIVGASGSGKSTLLHLLGGLDAPSAGSVQLAGRDFTTMDAAEQGALAQPAPRLRLPVPPPAARVQRARQRGDAAAHPSREPGRAARDGARPRWRRWAWPRACSTGRASCPAASASASRSRARWSRARPACSPTSPPATSTARPPTACSKPMLALARERGTAFVVVTHDEALAARCARVLRLRQGVLA